MNPELGYLRAIVDIPGYLTKGKSYPIWESYNMVDHIVLDDGSNHCFDRMGERWPNGRTEYVSSP